MEDKMIKDKKHLEYSVALVSLLKGAVYKEDSTAWNQLMTYTGAVRVYFEKINLDVLIDEQEGFAFLKSKEAEDSKSGSGLIVRRPISRNATALYVVLRAELRDWEKSEREDQICILSRKQIREKMIPYTELEPDEAQFRLLVDVAITQACNAKILRPVSGGAVTEHKEDQLFQIERIIKARLPIEDLVAIKEKLIQVGKNSVTESEGTENAVEYT